ncbi:MAG: PIN domain-containing protein [Candidatus Riflebacteria bacterium]|nr:PIN domain-containing protein [Candidatus Riflebacteria bacterium]
MAQSSTTTTSTAGQRSGPERRFVDTGALVALADRKDQFHGRAKEFFGRHARAARWLTSDYVLDETATRLRAALGSTAAVTFVRAVRASAFYEVLPVDEGIFEAALEVMLKYADQSLSFTDCTSFALMQHLDLREVFGFDADFLRCGFVLVP